MQMIPMLSLKIKYYSDITVLSIVLGQVSRIHLLNEYTTHLKSDILARKFFSIINDMYEVEA
jgi:hypothetical protein